MSEGFARSKFDVGELKALQGITFRARYLVEGYLSGLHRSPFQGASVEFSEYRDYRTGDDMRQIDWRLFARSDRLYTKRFEQETEARVYLILDRSASMGYGGSRAWANKATCAGTLAASLAWMLLRQRDSVGLLGFRAEKVDQRVLEYLSPSQRPGRLNELLSSIERLPIQGGSQLPELLAHAVRLIRRRSVVLVFTDLLDPSDSIEVALKQLRFSGHEVVVFQTLDPDEVDLPFEESGVFVDPETGERRNVDPVKARASYLKQFTAFMNVHRELFSKIQVRHGLFVGDKHPGPELARFLGV